MASSVLLKTVQELFATVECWIMNWKALSVMWLETL